jgi:hypothetical protein
LPYTLKDFGYRGRYGVPAFFIILVLLAFPQIVAAQRTNVLFVGAAELLNGIPEGPFWHLLNDPFFDVTPVRAFFVGDMGYSTDVIYKAVRLYMPRTYNRLTEDYQVITLFLANRGAISSKYTKWISDAVTKNGMGLILIGQENNWAYDWMVTTVGEVLPLEMLTPQHSHKPASIKIIANGHVLATSLPWSSIGEHGNFPGQSLTKAREGSEVIANTVSFMGSAYPFLGWWDVGTGRSLAMMPVFEVGENPFLDWEFLPDLCSNLNLYVARRQIPEDPVILHQLRMKLEQFRLRSGMLVGTLEFLSRLGGNPTQVERAINHANERLEEVKGLYLVYEFESALDLAGISVTDLERAEKLVMELKDRTLFWIYTIEWSILTATSLLTGVLLWALMIKRQLYVEVRSTKLTKTRAVLLASNVEVTHDD